MISHSLEHEAESISNYAEGDIPETEPEGFSRDPGEVVAECIRNDELKPDHGGRWRLETEVNGFEWRLVVSEDHLVQTALVPGVHACDDHDPAARFGGDDR